MRKKKPVTFQKEKQPTEKTKVNKEDSKEVKGRNLAKIKYSNKHKVQRTFMKAKEKE